MVVLDSLSLMNIASAHLDPQELLHLALLASQENRHDQAIGLLKQGLALAPDDPKLLFLLGAEHAQIGLYDRAIEEIGQSVRLDASVPAAHFQLGLLYLMRGDGARARQALAPLGELAPGDPFRMFSDGLLRLLENDLAGCMQRVLESALAVQAQGAEDSSWLALGHLQRLRATVILSEKIRSFITCRPRVANNCLKNIRFCQVGRPDRRKNPWNAVVLPGRGYRQAWPPARGASRV